MESSRAVHLLVLALAALVALKVAVTYARTARHPYTTMGEEMTFGHGWGLASVLLGVGVAGWVPWWVAVPLVPAVYLLGGPLRDVFRVIGRLLLTPASDDAGEEEPPPEPRRRLPG